MSDDQARDDQTRDGQQNSAHANAQENAQAKETSAYELLGGEAQLHALVDRFYDLMDEAPEYYAVRKLHPATLEGSREKLKMYLSGWLGGPNHYIERYGHPRLRARHLPFAIASIERVQWLAEPLKTRLHEAFYGTADWMRNRDG